MGLNGLEILALGILAACFALGFSALVSVCRLLRVVRPENRSLQPLLVWLNLIPLLNLVLWPSTVIRVARSIRAEYLSSGIAARQDCEFGMTTGLGSCVGMVSLPVQAFAVQDPPCFAGLFIVGLILLFVYIQEINGYRRVLAEAHGGDPPWWDGEAE